MGTYTYDQVLKASIKYFNGDVLAASTVTKKYLLRDKESNFKELTPSDMHIRLASEFTRIEKKMNPNLDSDAYYKKVFGLIDQFKKVVPQGSPMSAIGNQFQIQSLSNCFVVPSPVDSVSGIFKTGWEMAEIEKRRGGVGLDISTLRPMGSKVNNAALHSCGTPGFSDFFSYITRMIGQLGRQGALMITIDITHPDSEAFAVMKNDMTKVTGANVSIKLTDKFMMAVEKDEMFTQQWPVDVPESEAKIIKKIKARDIWDVIVQSAWKTAEPGLLMWGNYTKTLPANYYPGFETQSVNPCQPGYATVLTKEGIRTFDDIEIGSVIWSGKQWTKVTNKAFTGVKPVYRYVTSTGEFIGTENHRIISDGERVEAKDAETIDISTGPCPENEKLNIQHVMDGLVIGDGTVHKLSGNLVLLNIGEGDEEYIESEISSLLVKRRDKIMSSGLYYEIDTTIKHEELPRTYDRVVPDRYFLGDNTTKRGFLRGLFSANGSVVKNGRIRLKQSSYKLIHQTQLMLSSLGISSYIVTNKPREIEFSNGVYTPKVSYDLNIHADRFKFAELIGFIHTRKNDDVSGGTSGKRSTTSTIKKVEFLEETKVYDITVEAEEHTYWTGGCLVSNCAEIGLSPYDSCRLISNNLFGWVKNPFTKDAKFDFDEYFEDTKIAQRMSDGLVELEIEAVNKIIESTDNDEEKNLWGRILSAGKNGRRTGLGTHGLADAMLALSIKYDSDQACEFASILYRCHRDASYEASVDMAEERGAFPIWNFETDIQCQFIQNLKPELIERIKKVGRRNISNLTCAPTGSVSVASQTSSGIEPVFRWVYDRMVKITHSDMGFPTDFVDQTGDKWTKFRVVHPTVKMYFENNGMEMPIKDGRNFDQSIELANKTLQEKLPSYFITSDKVDYIKGIDLQAVAQQYIDHGISKTINMPKGSTKEQVNEVYIKAWKAGLKGVTVYVDGSRDGVLITENKEEDKKKSEELRPDNIIDSHAPRRPSSLPADIHHTKVKGQNWTVVVGLMDGRPFEVFAGKSLSIPAENTIESAHIKKSGSKKYSLSMVLKNSGTEEIADLKEIYDNPEQRVITRSVCRELRHGIPVEFTVRDLEDHEGTMTDYASALARVLKRYVTKAGWMAKTCSQCGSKEFRLIEGCVQCISCMSSKCN